MKWEVCSSEEMSDRQMLLSTCFVSGPLAPFSHLLLNLSATDVFSYSVWCSKPPFLMYVSTVFSLNAVGSAMERNNTASQS